jgi:hypothetical protein
MTSSDSAPLSAQWLLLEQFCAAHNMSPRDYLAGGYVVEGLSYRGLAARIREDIGLAVSHEWTRQQVERLGIERAA